MTLQEETARMENTIDAIDVLLIGTAQTLIESGVAVEAIDRIAESVRNGLPPVAQLIAFMVGAVRLKEGLQKELKEMRT